MIYDTRTLLELSVGKTHTVEVLVNLRMDDLDWWNHDLTRHTEQLIKLISRRILPVECKDEIENHHSTRTNRDYDNIQRGALQARGAPSVSANTSAKSRKRREVAEVSLPRSKRKSRMVNERKQTQVKITTGAGTKARTNNLDSSSSLKTLIKGSSSRKNGVTKTGNNVEATKGKGETNNERPYASGLDIKFAFSDDDIQITYKVEPVIIMNSVTLSYQTSGDVSNCGDDSHDDTASVAKKKHAGKGMKRLSSFRRLQKLSKRIVIWCYPFDALNPMKPTLEKEGGFPRPEMIPISCLFSDNKNWTESL